MRLDDASDYVRLRRLAQNPWEIVRFRKRQKVGDTLSVKLRSSEPLLVRGGLHDFHVFHRIFLRDEYQVSGLGALGCVIDLGANVGFFSARIARSAQRIIAYEPAPDNFAQLKLNLRSLANVTLVQGAVAGRSGPLRLFRPESPSRTGMHSSFAELDGVMSERFDVVHAITLDELFARHAIDHCDLLKLDVEGQEYEIIGAASPRTLARIDRIHGEYHDVAPQNPATRIANFAAFLEERGFAVELLPKRGCANDGLFFATRHA